MCSCKNVAETDQEIEKGKTVNCCYVTRRRKNSIRVQR